MPLLQCTCVTSRLASICTTQLCGQVASSSSRSSRSGSVGSLQPWQRSSIIAVQQSGSLLAKSLVLTCGGETVAGHTVACNSYERPLSWLSGSLCHFQETLWSSHVTKRWMQVTWFLATLISCKSCITALCHYYPATCATSRQAREAHL